MNYEKPGSGEERGRFVAAIAVLLVIFVGDSKSAPLAPRLPSRVLSAAASAIRPVRHHRRRHWRRHAKPSPAPLTPAPPPQAKTPPPAPPPVSPPKAAPEAPAPGAVYGPPPPPPTWSAAEIEAAGKECDRLLDGLNIAYDKLPPIKEGECGLPAPIRLRGFDSERAPPVAFRPAPAVSCKLAAALRHWFDGVVQPAAKAKLDATIVEIGDLSAYDCRPRYDDPNQRISQHAFANAIDISEFVTAKGEHVSVLDQWNAADEPAAFLREVHDGACNIFGTTLGPDANDAHKNHFHLDMAPRRHRGLCDFTPRQLAERRAEQRRASATHNTGAMPAGQSGATHARAEPSSSKTGQEADAPAGKQDYRETARRHHHRHRRHRHSR